jgi:hypothetical protein
MLALLHVLGNVLLLLLVLLMLVVMVLVLLKLDVSSTGKSIATMDGCKIFVIISSAGIIIIKRNCLVCTCRKA